METNSEKDFLKMIGVTGTKRILDFLDQHDKTQYKDLAEFMNTHTLNARLRELLRYDLIEHHIIRDERKAEWYVITEKGRTVLYLLKSAITVVQPSFDSG